MRSLSRGDSSTRDVRGDGRRIPPRCLGASTRCLQYAGFMILGVSTSPRRTLLWAVDLDSATHTRAVLTAHGVDWRPGELGGLTSELVTETEVGVVALEALEALVDAGFTFRWAD